MVPATLDHVHRSFVRAAWSRVRAEYRAAHDMHSDSGAGAFAQRTRIGLVGGDDDELIAVLAGRVHIAGEHTAGPWAGLMEGAPRSGLRAAGEVLALAE